MGECIYQGGVNFRVRGGGIKVPRGTHLFSLS